MGVGLLVGGATAQILHATSTWAGKKTNMNLELCLPSVV